MAKVILDIPDKYIDMLGWARETLAEHGISGEVVSDEAAPAEDPWAGTDTSSETGEDPWNAPSSGSRPARTTSPPKEAAASSVQPATPPKSGKYSADGKTHEFGLEGAPLCDHNQPAVRVSGKNAKGKSWKQYRCALSSTDIWKDKCDFSEWA